MENQKYLESLIDNLSKRVDKNETDVSDVKKEVNLLNISNAEIKVKLTSIELSTEQIKNMINENTKENEKASHNNHAVITELISAIKEDRQSDHKAEMKEQEDKTKIALHDRKEIWAILGAIITALITYFTK